MPNSIENKKGYKSNYSGVPWDSIPTDERFNPYDYISQDNYKSTKRGQAAYAEDLARLQYLADLRQQDWQNAYNEAQLADSREYNSYANQVALMREAGLNPDLLGVSAGSSSPLNSSSGPSASGGINPMSGMPTAGETAGSIISIIGTVAQVAAGLFTGGLSAVGTTLANASAGVSLLGNVIGSSDDFAGSDVASIISSLPLSSGQRKKLDKVYRSVFGSARSQDANNKFWTKYKQNESEFMKSQISPFYNPDDSNSDGIIDVRDWSAVWEPLFDAQFENMKKELSSKSSELDYSKKHYEFESDEDSILSSFKAPLLEVVQNMKKRYDDGDQFYGYALTVVYALLKKFGL